VLYTLLCSMMLLFYYNPFSSHSVQSPSFRYPLSLPLSLSSHHSDIHSIPAKLRSQVDPFFDLYRGTYHTVPYVPLRSYYTTPTPLPSSLLYFCSVLFLFSPTIPSLPLLRISSSLHPTPFFLPDAYTSHTTTKSPLQKRTHSSLSLSLSHPL
jgi:hypothetical protein